MIEKTETSKQSNLLLTLSRIGNAFRLSRIEWSLLAMVFVFKAVLLYFGVAVHEVYQNSYVDYPLGPLAMWNRWDGPNYLHIAQHGYVTTGDHKFSLVFFPGYPLLIALGMKLGLSPVASAFLVSGIATGFVAILLFRLARLDYDEHASRNAVWFQFIFPTAYFLHSVLTESTFIAFMLGTFLAARKRRWVLCGILAFLATITRMNGILLLVPLLIEMVAEWREKRKPNTDWIFLLLPLVGIALFLQINHATTGNALMFLKYQKEHWSHHFAYPWDGVASTINFSRWGERNSALMTGTQEFIFAFIGLIFTVVAAFRLRPSYAVWMLLNWLSIVSLEFVVSVPRYTLVFFPIFLLWGELGKRRTWFEILTIANLLFFGFFAALYAQGRWSF